MYTLMKMKNERIPKELKNLLTEEEIVLFTELRIQIKELNKKTNLTRLIEGEDYWISQVYDSIWAIKGNLNYNFDKQFLLFKIQRMKKGIQKGY